MKPQTAYSWHGGPMPRPGSPSCRVCSRAEGLENFSSTTFWNSAKKVPKFPWPLPWSVVRGRALGHLAMACRHGRHRWPPLAERARHRAGKPAETTSLAGVRRDSGNSRQLSRRNFVLGQQQAACLRQFAAVATLPEQMPVNVERHDNR